MEKEIEPIVEEVEFSPYEFGTVISQFAMNLQEALKHSKKTYRYKIKFNCSQIDHKKPKEEK